ncbi:beta-1,3-glucan-binding protein-like [Agrilus planipennis]|uniref:Beta-1,3-glucan-binding protein-like n=1 Tax=Agrilus planipennis TaxID=224129 RepID=A0A1W4XEG8_AGRPL|nr:beta-1,3-glucan-binding protein-like [Agrilus planipennis]XP_025836434.1 beta-1,3-glucan-binding protein-like [Agrilus planipennis]
MLKFTVLLCGCFVAYVYGDCLSSITKVGGEKAPSTVCSGDLVFQDEFDFLDFTKWQHENTLTGGGNWEFEWYTNNRTNSYVSDGVLKIVPTLTADHVGEAGLTSTTVNLYGATEEESCTNNANYGCERSGTPDNILNPIKSARLRTYKSFHFTYGRVEIRAKMPKGDWIWPAIWMMPRYNAYGGWPTSGEIDISEVRGNADLRQNGEQIGVQQHGSTLHWGPSFFANRDSRTHWTKNNAAGWNDDFHVYGVTWTDQSITFTVDGETIGSVAPNTNFWDFGDLANSGYSNPWGTNSRMAPFDQNFYIILNVAVGGTNYFPDDVVNGNGAKPWENTSGRASTDFWNGRNQWLPTWDGLNSALQVDYVRVYAI